jgi:hypothetical protein
VDGEIDAQRELPALLIRRRAAALMARPAFTREGAATAATMPAPPYETFDW